MTNQEKIICLSPSGPVDFAVRHAREIWARHRPDLTLEVSVRRDAADPAGTAGQGYRLRVAGTSVRIEGDDEAGAMYGVLDVADQVEAGTWRDTLADRDVAPRIEKRGIKFNIPLDARTPSYSDNGDSAQENIDTVWDMDFWRGFIDRMALDRFNVLTLWNMSPGPSLVRVPAFPDVALDDVMRASHAPNSDLRGMALYTPVQADSLVRLRRLSIDDKIRFWRGVMEYARERCVSVWLFTWNIYVYGTE
ncbi:MAG: hypothetical protein KBA30_10375, partial [Clostridia bacterium]|nr:hypothetical protein [Clostridia bacterium]